MTDPSSTTNDENSSNDNQNNTKAENKKFGASVDVNVLGRVADKNVKNKCLSKGGGGGEVSGVEVEQTVAVDTKPKRLMTRRRRIRQQKLG
jgi:hypothetical protein